LHGSTVGFSGVKLTQWHTHVHIFKLVMGFALFEWSEYDAGFVDIYYILLLLPRLDFCLTGQSFPSPVTLKFGLVPVK